MYGFGEHVLARARFPLQEHGGDFGFRDLARHANHHTHGRRLAYDLVEAELTRVLRVYEAQLLAHLYGFDCVPESYLKLFQVDGLGYEIVSAGAKRHDRIIYEDRGCYDYHYGLRLAVPYLAQDFQSRTVRQFYVQKHGGGLLGFKEL